MVAQKSKRPPPLPRPDTTIDVDPSWLVEFDDDEEEPTLKRRPSRRPKATPAAEDRLPRGLKPLPVPRPTITSTPGNTMEVDPQWLEAEDPSKLADDDPPTRPKRRSQRPPAKASQRPPARVPRPAKK